MAYRKALDEYFIEGAIKTVAEIGIENMRTKHVADYAGFSEATMFRRFPTKKILLRETFLAIDKRVSSILTESEFIQSPSNNSCEFVLPALWHKVYCFLIEHKEETIFLIRYRYSSLYTDEVRSMQQAFNGGFDSFYEAFELYSKETANREFLFSLFFEMTLGFAEKVVTGKISVDRNTERRIWRAISGFS